MTLGAKLGSLAALTCLTIPMAASAAVVASDDFTAGVGAWSKGPTGTSNYTLSAADDSAGIGSGQAMDLNITQSATRSAVLPFAATTIPDGSTLTVSFDIRMVNTPAAGDRNFRFGVYNNPTSSPADATGTGFTGRLDIGTGAANYADIFDSNGVFNTTTTAGSKSLVSDGTDAGLALSDTTARFVTLTLSNSGGAISGTLSEQTNLSDPNSVISFSSTTPDATPSTLTFNELAIGMNSSFTAPIEFRIDNVNISLGATAPEPASLGLFGAGALLLVKRRRTA